MTNQVEKYFLEMGIDLGSKSIYKEIIMFLIAFYIVQSN